MTRPFALGVRQAALREIVEQADFYRRQANETLVQRWNIAVKSTIDSLRQMPERGAPYGLSTHAPPTIRRLSVKGFIHFSIFYEVDPSTHLVTVVAVLHASRDVEPILFLPRE